MGIGAITSVIANSGAEPTLDLTTAATNYSTVWNKVVTLLAGNAVLSIFLFGGLIAMCWRHFRKAKGAVKG